MLECDSVTDPKSLKYYLSPAGISFAEELIDLNSDDTGAPSGRFNDSDYDKSYFKATLDVAEGLASLQTQSTAKLNSYLNSIFKGI